MNFYISTAKRARKCHYLGNSTFDKRVIKPGEKHLRLSNGTIGQGCKELNTNRYDSIILLEKMLVVLKAGIPATKPKIRSYPKDYAEDEIPF